MGRNRLCYYCGCAGGMPENICAACDKTSIPDAIVVSSAIFSAVIQERNRMNGLLVDLGSACEDYCYWSERDTGGGAPDQYETMKRLLGEVHEYLTELEAKAQAEIEGYNTPPAAEGAEHGRTTPPHGEGGGA